MADLAAERAESATGLEGIPQPGDVVGGKFVVERVLGVGGMGIVVSARHVQLGQSVAIKFLRHGALTNPESVNRFLREARASVGLQSAHVVRVMDVGTLDDGLPYMVMEQLNGTDLGQLLEARGVLPVEEAVDCLVQAMDAVAEAHSVGIVHRDLKPSNLFLIVRPDGSSLVKVLDFGISKAVDGGGPPVNLTATTMVLGSPLYMSPEQVRSTKSVDTRTDVWALGVILYELVAGLPPFEAETVTGLCAKIVADPPVPLRSRRPDISPVLEAIVARCLDKDVTRRYRTVADLAVALRPFASTEGRMAVDRIARMSGSRPTTPSLQDTAGSAARSAVEAPLEVAAGYAETVASWQTTGIRRHRRIVTGVALLFAALAALATMGLVLRARHLAAPPMTPLAIDMSLTPTAVAGSHEAAVTATAVASVAAPALAVTVAPPPSAAAEIALASAPLPPPKAAGPAPLAAHPGVPKPSTAGAPALPVKAVADDLLLDRK